VQIEIKFRNNEKNKNLLVNVTLAIPVLLIRKDYNHKNTSVSDYIKITKINYMVKI